MFTRLIGAFCLVILLERSYGRHHKNPHCDPSACGNIRNISYPFRLGDDPDNCGLSEYELVCENNSTLVLYIRSQIYLVHSINYHNFTIHLVDASININNNNCFPQQYIRNEHELASVIEIYSNRRFYTGTIIAWPVTFLSCQYPVSYSFYVKYDTCIMNRNSGRNTYITIGGLNALEVGDNCTIDLVVMTSMPFKDTNNFSLQEVHQSLVYGFEVSWYIALCRETCRGFCEWDDTFSTFRCIPPLSYQDISGRIIHLLLDIPHIGAAVIIASLTLAAFMGAKHVIGVPILLGLLMYKLRRRNMSAFDIIEQFIQHHSNLVPIRYSYPDIKKITKGFQDKLGQGGYGSVYKGKLRSGHDVAVKLLSAKSRSNGQDFMNEVATIGRIHHVNVVNLVGYCAEGSKRALLYDFMPNGSLEKYIHRQEMAFLLNWEKKYEIAVGVARGIEYLHQGCDIQILHFDIKPHNILLDDKFSPKISDFGLARFFSTETNTVILTAARGTIGYVAPELINRSIGGVSYKADVYSFGMLLMELVGLKKDLVPNAENSSQYFPDWIYNHLDKWKDTEIGNTDEEIDEIDTIITRKMAIVALWCIQMSPSDRPSMNRVVEMLEGEIEALQIPPRPSHSPEERYAWETDTTDSTALLCEDNSTD